MQLLLIRHGRPVRAESSAGDGVDPGLAPAGREQAAQLASFLTRPGARRIDAVYSSPMLRATQTAGPLAARVGVEVVVEPGVVEFDHGVPAYIPHEEFVGDRRQQWRDLLDGRWHGHPVDLSGFQRDVVATLEGLVRRHRSGTVAIVCHGGVINAYLAHVLETASPMFFVPDYTSVTRVLAAADGFRQLRTANDTAHLQIHPVHNSAPTAARPAR